MAYIRQNVQTAFYIRYVYVYYLRHIKDGTVIVYYSNMKGSPRINEFSKTEEWLSKKEMERLDPDNIRRPDSQ